VIESRAAPDSASLAISSDPELLRWAARETLPCAVVLPGRRSWCRSQFVALREDGPRPHVAVAQAVDLRSRELRVLQAGESVRLWSVRDGQPFCARGFVFGTGVVESRTAGPVAAALIRLPHRLFASGTLLRRPMQRERTAVRVAIAVRGPGGQISSHTVIERWQEPSGAWAARGNGHMVEVSRRTLTLSLPRSAEPVLLQGAGLRLEINLIEDELRTVADARVAVTWSFGDQVLYGIVMDKEEPSVSSEEHREVLRRFGEMV